MTIENAIKEIKSFINSPISHQWPVLDNPNKSLFINGEWGIGKTHAIKEIIKPYSTLGYKIVYYSLAGLTDSKVFLDDMKALLIPGRHLLTKIINSMSFETSLVNVMSMSFSPHSINDVEHTKGYISALQNNDYLIVFDDLERLRSMDCQDSFLRFFLLLQDALSFNSRIFVLFNGNRLPRDLEENDYLSSFINKASCRQINISSYSQGLVINIFGPHDAKLFLSFKDTIHSDFNLENLRTIILIKKYRSLVLASSFGKTFYNVDNGLLLFFLSSMVALFDDDPSYFLSQKQKIEDNDIVLQKWSRGSNEVMKAQYHLDMDDAANKIAINHIKYSSLVYWMPFYNLDEEFPFDEKVSLLENVIDVIDGMIVERGTIPASLHNK
jgi:hypothetical protein